MTSQIKLPQSGFELSTHQSEPQFKFNIEAARRHSQQRKYSPALFLCSVKATASDIIYITSMKVHTMLPSRLNMYFIYKIYKM